MAIMGMGQGEVLMTPLQMANSICIIANKGFYYIPHFVKSIGGDSTNARLAKYKQKHVVANIPDSAYNAVGYGMQDVVDGGTGKIARIPGIEVCAKTGTAQNPHGKDHAFFVGFAPSDNPQIAFAIVVENVGFGGTYAAPIAEALIKAYLKKETLKKDSVKTEIKQPIAGVNIED